MNTYKLNTREQRIWVRDYCPTAYLMNLIELNTGEVLDWGRVQFHEPADEAEFILRWTTHV